MSELLVDRMRAMADAQPNSVHAKELREKSEALERATADFYAEPQKMGVKEFMGHYARARLFWCKVTGESLV